ncbi:MAG: hypothetical protein M1818_006324 [Claussenomyces sp. TS43310]|nr:MAG: hypothetical protein M1818_006324 [Claussenomyces sp. TS43310]
MANSQKRITKELAENTSDTVPGISVTLVNESDVHSWDITLKGPGNSPYTASPMQTGGGTFKLLLVLPTDYPFKPPKLNFKTKIFHPNVTNDDTGSMCLGILKGDVWKPSSKIRAVLEAAQQLLVEPIPDDAVNTNASDLYKNDRKGFNEQAKEWTKKYAGEK